MQLFFGRDYTGRRLGTWQYQPKVENLANSSAFSALGERGLKHLPHAIQLVALPIPEEFGEPIIVRMSEKALRFAMEQCGKPFLPVLGGGSSLVPTRNYAFISAQGGRQIRLFQVATMFRPLSDEVGPIWLFSFVNLRV